MCSTSSGAAKGFQICLHGAAAVVPHAASQIGSVQVWLQVVSHGVQAMCRELRILELSFPLPDERRSLSGFDMTHMPTGVSL